MGILQLQQQPVGNLIYSMQSVHIPLFRLSPPGLPCLPSDPSPPSGNEDSRGIDQVWEVADDPLLDVLPGKDKGKEVAQGKGIRAAAEEVVEEDRVVAQDRGIRTAAEVVEDRVAVQDKEAGSQAEVVAAAVLNDKEDTDACYDDQGTPFRSVHPPYAHDQDIMAHWEQRCSRKRALVDSKEE
ncbi:hypothetical protein N7499_002613 [Penicillium canescens]|nr:hypothetical protein N7499_002613 [Penicillium canescens]